MTPQSTENEKWVDLFHSENYMISSLGRIFSKERKLYKPLWGKLTEFNIKGKFIKPGMMTSGYLFFFIHPEKKPISIHRAVLCSFSKAEPAGKTVNHKNGIKTDNRLENLEWMTYRENNIHARTSGINKVIFSKEDVNAIRFFYCHQNLEILKKIFNCSRSSIQGAASGNRYFYL